MVAECTAMQRMCVLELCLQQQKIHACRCLCRTCACACRLLQCKVTEVQEPECGSSHPAPWPSQPSSRARLGGASGRCSRICQRRPGPAARTASPAHEVGSPILPCTRQAALGSVQRLWKRGALLTMSTNAFSSQITKGQWLQTIAIRIAFAPALSSSVTVFPDSGSGSCSSSNTARNDSLFVTRSVTGQV